MRAEECATLLILLAACESRGEPARGDVSASRSEPAALSSAQPAAQNIVLEQAVLAWLRDAAVTDERFARRTLYTWTTSETAERMRKDRRFFDDNQMPEGATAYVQWLEHVASKPRATGKLARLLLGHPDLGRRRYAWSRPWATRLGLGPRDYGDQLVRVELHPNAIVARFDPEGAPIWRFQDLDHREIPIGRVLADPHRLAAVLHVHRGEPRYREFVLCNASMLHVWSLGTPEIAEVLAKDAALARAMAAQDLPEIFARQEPLTGDAALIAAALAFHVGHYEPTQKNLTRVAERLEISAQRGDAFWEHPRVAFRHNAVPKIVEVRRLPPRLFAVDV